MYTRLKAHKYSNCYIDITDGRIVFISYNTEVIIAKRVGNTPYYSVYCTGLYSRTTIRQIGWFMQEYFPSENYYSMKKIAGTGCTIDIRRI